MNPTKYKQGSEDYLIDYTDWIIGDLVVEKEHLFKAYNYYLGFRDKYLFLHLEDNYGVGNPVSIKFTPLVRKHIDAIVGEYLTEEIKATVSCKDNKTLTNIMRLQLLAVAKKNREYVSSLLDNILYDAAMGNPQKSNKQMDPEIDKELKNIEELISLNFISDYEIAAQSIIQYVINSKSINLENARRLLFLDLLIAGEAFFKIVPTSSEKNFTLEIEDPLNTFVFKKHDSNDVKDGSRDVVRKWLTREEIAIEYGKYLSKEDLESLEKGIDFYAQEGTPTWIAAVNSRGVPRTQGIAAGVEVNVDNPYGTYFNMPYELIPVYTVEWIDYNKEEKKAIRYKTTRIGNDIYILTGEDDYLVRSQDDPDKARLALNGLFYTNRGEPYSMMLATADLLDLYDLLLYQKDNLIALGGTKGANVDVAHLPTFLGENMKERVLKYNAYRKMGLAFFDSSQEGDVVNTTFNGYDDSVSVLAILAILAGIEIIENTVTSITGVTRERLGGIQQRDAVANVELGMQASYIITKQYHVGMSRIISEIFGDSINMAKKVYKKGKIGRFILGDYTDIITLSPDNYSYTDYDVHIVDAKNLLKEQETIKSYALELTKGNMVDPVDLVTIASSKSLTEMKHLILKSAALKKKENNQVLQLTSSLEDALKLIKQLTKQLDASTKKIQQLDERKLAIEQQNNQMKQNIEWYKIQQDGKYKQKELDLIEQKNKLETAQLYDNNPRNDEIDDAKK